MDRAESSSIPLALMRLSYDSRDVMRQADGQGGQWDIMRSGIDKTPTKLTILSAGNTKLLEASPTHPQVLPRRRGPQRPPAQELHEWLPRGSELEGCLYREREFCGPARELSALYISIFFLRYRMSRNASGSSAPCYCDSLP